MGASGKVTYGRFLLLWIIAMVALCIIFAIWNPS